MKPHDDQIEETILRLAGARSEGRTICPSEAARALGGDKPEGWGPLMQPIRKVAVSMMKQGRIVITRKGRPVDPDDFKGVYRLRMPEKG